MKTNFVFLVLSIFILTGCEHLIVTPQEQRQAVFSGEDGMTPAEPTGPVAPVSGIMQRPPQTYGTLPSYDLNIASTSTDNVTIYSLDDPGTLYTPRVETPIAASPMGMPMSAQGQSQPVFGTSQADESIFFKHGSSRLGSNDRQKISQFADQAKFAPVNKVTVEGYASRPTQVGSDSVKAHVLNLKESMNRSFAVSKSLIQSGLPQEKIKTVSYGSKRATGDDDFDRRVDLIMGER
ncbi:MAG: OmpA family protein [Pseudomonadota bacterium]